MFSRKMSSWIKRNKKPDTVHPQGAGMRRRKTVSPGIGSCLVVVLSVAVALRGTNGSSSTDAYSLSSSANAVAFPNCEGYTPSIGDGDCDYTVNNVDCGYDGGDCCQCTCISTSSRCGEGGFHCKDPAAGKPILGCELVPTGPPAVYPCVGGATQHWVVETTADANLLADSTLCSGGIFEVEWQGHVFVNRTLYAIHGTVLDVVGATDAVVDGGGVTQLFAAFSGTLRVSELQMRYGAGFHGGAISATQRSEVTLTRVNFSSNVANGFGGAVHLDNSSLQLADSSTFTGNSAVYGGAIYMGNTSTLTQHTGSGEIYHFVDNNATDGGAVYMSGESSVSGYTRPHSTSTSSHVSSYSGAAYLTGSSNIHTSANILFVKNTAQRSGGAVYARDSTSSFDWEEEITLEKNRAEHGGALFIGYGASIKWEGVTLFSQNSAREDGGAVASAADASYLSVSYLRLSGAVRFLNNSCGGKGGALAWFLYMDVRWGETGPLFSGNSATLFGGAIYMSDAAYGREFENALFTENEAQSGGALFAAACGTHQNEVSSDEPKIYPTFISNCTFVGNSAQEAGGAIEIAVGRAHVESTVFSGNKARVGGALRLYGTVGLINSSFSDNNSGEGGGSAISNVGIVSEMVGLNFSANRFLCAPTEFLYFNEGNTTFAGICQGCEVSCEGCNIEESTIVPTCTPVFAHARSEGGTTTIEEVMLDPGHWRASNRSTNVLPCYNAEACVGGLTDDPEYCHDGYEGPYCSVCRAGYATTLAFTCSQCSDGNMPAIVVVLVIAVLAALALLWQLVRSLQQEDTSGGVLVHVEKVLPLQSIKIVIVAWQIVTQFSSVAHVIYPDIYQRLLDVAAFANFDIGWILSAGCIMNADFHDRLLVATVGPIVLIALLGVTYVVAIKRNRESEGAMHAVHRKHVGAVVFLTFFVYSSVSSAVFSTFACDELYDGNVYLRADYRIECDSPRHRAFRIYAGFMIFVYPVGIPAFYTLLLFREHKVMVNGFGNEPPRYESTSTLRKPYRPAVFYYEVVECSRRILLTGVVVFIYPNTAAQIAVTTAIAFAFVLISEGLRPYASRWDSWVSRTGHIIVFLSMYVALLLRVDVADERHRDQNVLAGILIAAHVIMILLVLVETMALMYSMRNQERLVTVS